MKLGDLVLLPIGPPRVCTASAFLAAAVHTCQI